MLIAESHVDARACLALVSHLVYVCVAIAFGSSIYLFLAVFLVLTNLNSSAVVHFGPHIFEEIMEKFYDAKDWLAQVDSLKSQLKEKERQIESMKAAESLKENLRT